jgi:hypothetical protein
MPGRSTLIPPNGSLILRERLKSNEWEFPGKGAICSENSVQWVWYRAGFQPSNSLGPFSWGVAPGWYGTGPLALHNAYKKRQRREYISLGQRPRKTSGKKTRAENPLHSFHALRRVKNCSENRHTDRAARVSKRIRSLTVAALNNHLFMQHGCAEGA